MAEWRDENGCLCVGLKVEPVAAKVTDDIEVKKDEAESGKDEAESGKTDSETKKSDSEKARTITRAK